VVPGVALAALGALAVLLVVMGRTGPATEPAVRIAGVAAGHGLLFTLALATTEVRWRRHAAVLIVLLLGAASAAQARWWGAVCYLAIPAALIALARRSSTLSALGLARPVTWRTAWIGAAAGAGLGAHLLLSSTRTFGYHAGIVDLGQYLAAVAYDIGANVPSAECFFRGVLFDRLQRKWPFGLAVGVASGASAFRYLVDPALPRAPETIAGAVFYLAILSAANCALFRWSGSLLPGALAGVGFFACYRALGGW
jgi:hypothetical protein